VFTGSILDEGIPLFQFTWSSQSLSGPNVYSACNRIQYHKIFLRGGA
jgi:hypothetical protein